MSFAQTIFSSVLFCATAAAAVSPYPDSKSRLDRMCDRLQSKPAFAEDAYVRLGIAIVRRFTAPDGDMAKLDEPWVQLQSRELSQVLDWTEKRIDDLSRGVAPIQLPRPAGGPIVAKDGVLFSPTTVGKSAKLSQTPYN